MTINLILPLLCAHLVCQDASVGRALLRLAPALLAAAAADDTVDDAVMIATAADDTVDDALLRLAAHFIMLVCFFC